MTHKLIHVVEIKLKVFNAVVFAFIYFLLFTTVYGFRVFKNYDEIENFMLSELR